MRFRGAFPGTGTRAICMCLPKRRPRRPRVPVANRAFWPGFSWRRTAWAPWLTILGSWLCRTSVVRQLAFERPAIQLVFPAVAHTIRRARWVWVCEPWPEQALDHRERLLDRSGGGWTGARMARTSSHWTNDAVDQGHDAAKRRRRRNRAAFAKIKRRRVAGVGPGIIR